MMTHRFPNISDIKKLIPTSVKQPIRENVTKYRNLRKRRKRLADATKVVKRAGLFKKANVKFRDILFIVIDCARRDHFSSYGYRRETTPFLERLREDAVFFVDAVASSSWTYPSVASLLSGLYPHHHGGVFTKDPRNFKAGDMPQEIRNDVLFLPEILGCFGFRTYFNAAIVTAALPVLGRFDTTVASHLKTSDKLITQYISWLRCQSGDTFSHLQLCDLHEPVQAPKSYRSTFKEIPDIANLTGWDYFDEVIPSNSEFERYREMRTALYDAALKSVDAQIKRLLSELNSTGRLQHMLIIITADHGEEFWDHMEMERLYFYDPRPAFGIGHGHHLWQEIVGVPLILFGESIKTETVKCRVSLVDVVPTILGLAGIEGIESLNLDGTNLFDKDPNRSIISESVQFGYEKKVVLKDKYKLYKSQGDNICWVFDLEQDPKEQNPLSMPDVAEQLSLDLPTSTDLKRTSSVAIDMEIKKRLEDLGYL